MNSSVEPWMISYTGAFECGVAGFDDVILKTVIA